MDGVDTEEFRPFAPEAVRQELNLPAGVPVAVFLGVLNRYQGIDILLEVVKIFRDRGVPLHFLVMGFPHQQYLRRAIAEGLSDRITFTGRIDYRDAARLLSAGDVALSPKVSLSEANGKLFNYMACGLPTVVFDNPVNREILGETGVYARQGDPVDFAARIEELLQDRTRMTELANAVREMAVRDHSWRSRGEQLCEIYMEMMKTACQ
jgi:glycosyltransferase involved in cell wall biosynthesis